MSSTDDLSQLREQLDALDRSLLDAAAQRARIVKSIAAAKAARSGGGQLFDRERERAVYARAMSIAETIELPRDVARELMQVLVEHSHRIQETASADASRVRGADQPVRLLIVGGDGRMGRRFAAAFERRGHAVDVFDVANGGETADDESVGRADLIMVAVPMEAAADTTAGYASRMRPDALLCDINSLKEDVCTAMSRWARGEAVGLHPMFGPSVHSLRRQKVVWCPVRAGDRAAWLRGELETLGMELIDSDPATHDRTMAVVQVLVHFATLVMGQALRHSGIELEQSLRFTSPIYRLELAFVGRLFAQNADLYAEIEMTNPHGAAARRRFLEAAASLNDLINAGDRAAFRDAFEDAQTYFRDFADEAMALSDTVIDGLVRLP